MPTDPPHILLVSPPAAGGTPPGEDASFAPLVERALRTAAAQAGLDVAIARLGWDGPAPAAMGATPDPLHGLDADALTARLRPADTVYVHRCLGEAGMFIAAHARLLGKRVVGCADGGVAPRLLDANPDAIAIYDAVHAPSAFAAAACADLPVTVRVVPGPVDTALFRPPGPPGPPGPDAPARDPGLVVALGRLLAQHGQDRVIRALPPGRSLVLLGAPGDPAFRALLEEAIRERAAQAGPDGGSVTFAGALDGPARRDLLHRAGTVVQASTHRDAAGRFLRQPELHGLAALEALASGAPTLVSDAGCLPELGALPGCRVFRTDAALAALLRHAPGVAADDAAAPMAAAEAAMHAAVAAGFGEAVAGRRLLALLGMEPACAS